MRAEKIRRGFAPDSDEGTRIAGEIQPATGSGVTLMVFAVCDVHDFAPMATAATLRAALADTRKARTVHASLALRATASAFDCDMPGAIALLRRALAIDGCPSDDSAYLRDLLIAYLLATGDIEGFELVLGAAGTVPPRLEPLWSATAAVSHAHRSEHDASRISARRAVALARVADAPSLLGRVLSRCSIAAFYRGDYDEARETALEGARLWESRSGYMAACAHSVLAAIASDWMCDGSLAADHFGRMLHYSELAGHTALARSALAASFHVAGERFDVATHGAIRARLTARQVHEQHQESFPLLLGEVLGYGWDGRFAAADAALTAYATKPRIRKQERALVDALLSAVAAAHWDVEVARSRSRAALRSTAQRVRNEPLYEGRYRELARVIAAATCFIIGDRIRGIRALSARFDRGHGYLELLSQWPIDASKCPEMFRGYARFVTVASECAREARPGHRLTPAELQLLQALPHGSTNAELAREMDKSKYTIARQLESIYDKLGARNRLQAVQLARDYGLFG